MSVTLNASTSSGLVSTADTSGTIELQSNGTTRLTVASTGVTIGGTFGGSVITAGTVNAGGTNPFNNTLTNVDFTGIPSWVKRITVMFDAVSTSGSSTVQVQIGDSGGIENTGYVSVSMRTNATGLNANSITTGFGFDGASASSAYSRSGSMVLTNLNGNIWTAQGAISETTDALSVQGGSKTLSATLDRVRVTTVNGTDTFDAGSINILYE